MSPVLLDERKVTQLLLLFVVALVLAFSGGYYLGYQPPQKTSAETEPGAVAGSRDTMEDTQSSAATATTAKESGKPVNHQKKSSSVKKDKTKKPANKKKQPDKDKGKNRSAKKKESQKPGKAQKNSTNKKISKNTKAKPVTPKTPVRQAETNVRSKSPSLTGVVNKEQAIHSLAMMQSPKAKTVYYSVQVGAFAREENAQKLVDEIKAKGFEAYISEYVSSRGIVKYNVRFGRFTDRAQGRKQLDAFKQQFSLSAYLVIVNQ